MELKKETLPLAFSRVGGSILQQIHLWVKSLGQMLCCWC